MGLSLCGIMGKCKGKLIVLGTSITGIYFLLFSQFGVEKSVSTIFEKLKNVCVTCRLRCSTVSGELGMLRKSVRKMWLRFCMKMLSFL